MGNVFCFMNLQCFYEYKQFSSFREEFGLDFFSKLVFALTVSEDNRDVPVAVM